MKEEKYGFKTKKVTLLKARMSDVKDIVKLYQRKTPQERKKLEENWSYMIQKSKDDFTNVMFVIRDKCFRTIGLLETETDDGKAFEIGIWIPNQAKQVQFLEHIKDSFLEWAEEETSMDSISSIKVLRKMTKNPAEAKYNVIAKGIFF